MSVEDPHNAERELRDEQPPSPGAEPAPTDAPDADDEQWDPEPATLRDGERREADAHARRNQVMLERAAAELDRDCGAD